MNLNEERPYTVRRVANYLGIHPSKVYELIRNGKLRAINISTGNSRPVWRVIKEDFDRFIQEQGNHN